MRSLAKQCYFLACRLLIPLLPERRVSILLYHDIGESDLYLTVPTERFRAQMKFLKDEGYRVISLSELFGYLKRGAPLPARTVVLTFDDAYHSHAGVVREVLEACGFPGTVFVPTGSLGGTLGNSEEKPQPILDEAALRDLATSGCVTLAPHSVSHREFTSLATTEVVQEIHDSKATLDELVDTSTCFAYPRGAYTREHAQLVAESGFAGAVTVRPGLVGPQSDPYELPRNTITSGTSWKEFRVLVSPAAGVAAAGLRALQREV